MRTRRSNKSFEMAPVNKRKSRLQKRRRAMAVVNETIVLSDSDDDIIVADDDIQVIDVAEESLAPTTQPPSELLRPIISKTEDENIGQEPVVIDIDDDAPDPDGIEVVAVMVTSGSKSSSKRASQSQLKRKSINGIYNNMQDRIKRAKNTVRRSSVGGGRNADLIQIQNPLYGISANSRKIGHRNINNFKRKKFNKRHGHGGGNLPNRNRELARQVFLKPDNSAETNFSFERTPFIPKNTSTPAFRRRNVQKRWMVPSTNPARAPIHPGSNIMNVGETANPSQKKGSLRPIVIDGSNVAVGHGGVLQGGGRPFSARGIEICVEYFKKRGHNEIVVFVPRFRLKRSESRDPELLEKLERLGHVKFTPSREAGEMQITSYDDLYVLEYGFQSQAIIVSNDNYRDVYETKPHLQDTIKYRLLQFTWINQDVIMFPEDPLGKIGPSLDEFLKF